MMGQMADSYKNIFPANKNIIWDKILENIKQITEIRIRVEKPILVYMNQKEFTVDTEGKISDNMEKGKVFTYKELQMLLDFWCMDSRYAFQNEICRGFLTLKGGHRIGICGEAVSDNDGKIQSIKYISSVNIRVAHEVRRVADKIMPYIYEKEKIRNTLIISPPGAGKTTLLRDIIRQISYGNNVCRGQNVGVVDERGEIAACYQGRPQLDVGPRTDVLDNCEKLLGMRMLLRTMSPQVIAVDELGNADEMQLIRQMTDTGCAVLATIHGDNREEIMKKDLFLKKEGQQIFQNIIVLTKENRIFHAQIYRTEDGSVCCSY